MSPSNLIRSSIQSYNRSYRSKTDTKLHLVAKLWRWLGCGCVYGHLDAYILTFIRTVTQTRHYTAITVLRHTNIHLPKSAQTLQKCSTPSCYNQGWCLLCAFTRFQHSSLHCFGSSVDLQILLKFKGVP
jgi:hypothetical protein